MTDVSFFLLSECPVLRDTIKMNRIFFRKRNSSEGKSKNVSSVKENASVKNQMEKEEENH